MNALVGEPVSSTRPLRRPLTEPRQSLRRLVAPPIIQQAQAYLDDSLGTPVSRELILGLLLALADQREAIHLAAHHLGADIELRRIGAASGSPVAAGATAGVAAGATAGSQT